MDQINFIYISSKGTKLLRGLRFIYNTIRFVGHFEGLVLVNYFEKCNLIKRLIMEEDDIGYKNTFGK